MSQIHERRYRIQREQEIAARRVKDRTREYVQRYVSILDDIKQQGLIEYVEAEYKSLKSELNTIESLLATDPFRAREISMSIGSNIHALPRIARTIRSESEQVEYEQQLESQRLYEEKQIQYNEKLNLHWQHEVSNWSDKLAFNLALKNLSELHTQLFTDTTALTEDKITNEIKSVKLQSEKLAVKRRVDISKESQGTALKEVQSNLVKEIQQSNLPEEKMNMLTEQLHSISSDVSGNDEDQHRIIRDVIHQTDSALVDEEVRREMTKAVYKSLKEAGFNVQKPKRVKANGKDEVVISASRPAGNRAKFKIELDGQCRYEFDNYKGQTCQKDIQQVLPKLSDVYGVDLSEERVIWSNPDDEDAEMKPIPSQYSKK